MTSDARTTNLQACFARFAHQSAWQSLQARLQDCEAGNQVPDQILSIYHSAIHLLETALWTPPVPNPATLALYQNLFREFEALLANQGRDDRYKFMVVIPVADRPKHLESCLQSLLSLCQTFHYGGLKEGRFNKVSVLIADDTKHQANIEIHRQLATRFTAQGLTTHYFGLKEQLALLGRFSPEEQENLTNILGTIDDQAFYHKGPSRMRNITYLKLSELACDEDRLLFYFIDSDQEFQICLESAKADRELYAINYFYELNEIYSHQEVSILTGKVVGDPPVSPAVMTGTFLEDVIAFLQRMVSVDHAQACQFHRPISRTQGEAAYHDMNDLFGFNPVVEAYEYACERHGEHDHTACFGDFARRLSHFFYGEHPTRKSYYRHTASATTTQPARTIYTGNYVLNRDGLSYFIPFARLKLRMAGPVLGRIIRAEIGERFVSANLPMLHNRTFDDSGESEFRPGINKAQHSIDLCGEFERQFFGDVMLFCMEKLTEFGFPQQPLSEQRARRLLEATYAEMLKKYLSKQTQIMERLTQLNSLFENPAYWWHQLEDLQDARQDFKRFIRNIVENFGPDSPCYGLIQSVNHRNERFREMVAAITQYTQDRQAWEKALKRGVI